MILKLGLNETIDRLAMANSVCGYGHVFRKEDGHVLRKHLTLKLKVKRRKGCRRAHGKQVEEESVKVDLIRKDALCRSKWIVGVNLIAIG